MIDRVLEGPAYPILHLWKIKFFLSLVRSISIHKFFCLSLCSFAYLSGKLHAYVLSYLPHCLPTYQPASWPAYLLPSEPVTLCLYLGNICLSITTTQTDHVLISQYISASVQLISARTMFLYLPRSSHHIPVPRQQLLFFFFLYRSQTPFTQTRKKNLDNRIRQGYSCHRTHR